MNPATTPMYKILTFPTNQNATTLYFQCSVRWNATVIKPFTNSLKKRPVKHIDANSVQEDEHNGFRRNGRPI